MVDLQKPTDAQIQEGLRLLNKKLERDAKIEAGLIKGHKSYADMTTEEKAKHQEYSKRNNAKKAILIRKATEAGITVSEAEIDAAIAAGK